MSSLRFCLLLALFCNFCACVQAQFEINRLSFRVGYAIQNPAATRFNYLIDQFNNRRYPLVTGQNLENLNFFTGFSGGVNYEVKEGLYLSGNLKRRGQFIETQFSGSKRYLAYFFRSITLEMGVYGKIRSEKWFEHFGGASLLVGNLSAFHQYGNLKGFRGSKNMLPIAQSFSMGLGLSYEARFVFSKYAALYLRPVIQYFLPSQIRNLNAYLNPFETEGELQYAPLDANKYNRGSLSGIGMEAGLLISLSNAKR